MRARLTMTPPCRIVQDGEIHGRVFGEGDELTGEAARTAIAAGWATAIDDASPPIPAPATPGEARPAEGVAAPRARLKRLWLHEGQRYAKGATLDGDLAIAAVAAGAGVTLDEGAA